MIVIDEQSLDVRPNGAIFIGDVWIKSIWRHSTKAKRKYSFTYVLPSGDFVNQEISKREWALLMAVRERQKKK